MSFSSSSTGSEVFLSAFIGKCDCFRQEGDQANTCSAEVGEHLSVKDSSEESVFCVAGLGTRQCLAGSRRTIGIIGPKALFK